MGIPVYTPQATPQIRDVNAPGVPDDLEVRQAEPSSMNEPEDNLEGNIEQENQDEEMSSRNNPVEEDSPRVPERVPERQRTAQQKRKITQPSTSTAKRYERRGLRRSRVVSDADKPLTKTRKLLESTTTEDSTEDSETTGDSDLGQLIEHILEIPVSIEPGTNVPMKGSNQATGYDIFNSGTKTIGLERCFNPLEETNVGSK